MRNVDNEAQEEADSSQEADVQKEHEAQQLLFEPFVTRRNRSSPSSLTPALEADEVQAQVEADTGQNYSSYASNRAAMITRRRRQMAEAEAKAEAEAEAKAEPEAEAEDEDEAETEAEAERLRG